MIDRFEDFTTCIAQAQKYILKIKSHEMQIFGLKASHVMCLFYMGKYSEGLTAGELTSLCMEDKAGISKALAELKKKELIIPYNENGKKIYRAKYLLTEKGKEIYEKASEIISNVVTECGIGLSNEERTTFYRSLELIVSNLKRHCDNMENALADK